MDTNEPTIVNISTNPSTKEQLIGAAIGLAFIASSVVVTAASFYVVGKVAEKIEARQVRKANQDLPNEE